MQKVQNYVSRSMARFQLAVKPHETSVKPHETFLGEAPQISKPTLWRWCAIAEIPSGRKFFTQEEFQKLEAIAAMRQLGLNYGEISDLFDNKEY